MIKHFSLTFKLGILLSVLFVFDACTDIKSESKKEANIPIIHRDSPTEDIAVVYPKLNALYQTEKLLRFKSSIRAIFQDRKGNFWFGSQNEGVCRFDGTNFTYFTKKDGLSHNQIKSIQEDEDGNIWFDTGKGICYFNGEQFITAHPEISHGPIQDIKNIWKEDSSKALWFGVGRENGVYRYLNNKLVYLPIPVPKSDSLPNHVHGSAYEVHHIFTHATTTWFSTLARGVIGFNGDSFIYPEANQSKSSLLKKVFQESSHELFTTPTFTDQLDSIIRFWVMEQDQEGALWLGTLDTGLWYYNGTSLLNYTINDGLSSNAITSIHKDQKGNLWIGTADGKVCIYNGKSFTSFGTDNC